MPKRREPKAELAWLQMVALWDTARAGQKAGGEQPPGQRSAGGAGLNPGPCLPQGMRVGFQVALCYPEIQRVPRALGAISA